MDCIPYVMSDAIIESSLASIGLHLSPNDKHFEPIIVRRISTRSVVHRIASHVSPLVIHNKTVKIWRPEGITQTKTYSVILWTIQRFRRIANSLFNSLVEEKSKNQFIYSNDSLLYWVLRNSFLSSVCLKVSTELVDES